MATLRNYHHDFARLAKQSGYYFQLHRGRVNWSEIESLNIEDVIENRNFDVLEHNLVNVVNCNLEREYDFKILDPNFVKLFKLAQLGVDYLSYCELYLDRCVILLQEQLTAYQEECESLKRENLRKSDELKKFKNKTKTQNYQCEKCQKIFISEVYLKCHDKRRHSNLNTFKAPDMPLKKFTDRYQQTVDNEIKQSETTQTLSVDKEREGKIIESEQITKIKKENSVKIEHMERELEDLKSRLKKAEAALGEKLDVSISTNVHQPFNFPSPIFYPPMLPFVPSYIPQPRNGYLDVPVGNALPVPRNRQTDAGAVVPESINPQINLPESLLDQATLVKDNNFQKANEKEVLKDVKGAKAALRGTRTSGGIKRRKKVNLNKENVDPQKMIDAVKPRTHPKKKETMIVVEEDHALVEMISPKGNNEEISEPALFAFCGDSIARSSTPIKESQEAESNVTDKPNVDDESIWNENSIVQEALPPETKPKSFIQKMVTRNSPKLQEFSKNLKRSLTNLYDSVSAKGKEIVESSPKTGIVDGLNTRLRDLGVDPEWNGIPKKTVKQKLKDVKYRRQLMAKENPMYPAVRRKIEKNIFKKLSKNSINFKAKRDTSGINEQESVEGKNTSGDIRIIDSDRDTVSNDPEAEEVVKSQKPAMYDIETCSETDVSDLETPEKQERALRQSTLKKELTSCADAGKNGVDLSVFQVDKESSTKNSGKNRQLKNVNDLLTDSDFDGNFRDDFEYCSFQKIPNYLVKASNEEEDRKISPSDTLRGCEATSKYLPADHEQTESQSILKSIQKIQSKAKMQKKKKVLFAEGPTATLGKVDESEMYEEDLRWSSESEWDEKFSELVAS